MQAKRDAKRGQVHISLENENPLMVRDDIINNAKYWADPGTYKPVAEELVQFFKDANTEQAPTKGEAQSSLDSLVTGCFVGGRDKKPKQWCGIFACSIARNAGLNVKWTLLSGQILGVKKIWGHSGVQPGDIAITNAPFQHHFIVIDVNSSGYAADNGLDPDLITTVDGNTAGQLIRLCNKNISVIDAYYRMDGV